LHLFHLRNNKHPNPHLQNCFNKYGENNFIFDIIYRCNNLEELNKKEKQFIIEYKSLDRTKGYNIRQGGTNELLSIEHKDKISKALIGNINGTFGKGKARNRPKGISHSNETKLRISNALKGHKRTKESIDKTSKARQRKIEQLTLNGVHIKDFASIKQASMETGISRTHINLCCLNKKKSSRYIFKYKDCKAIPNENII